jgi:hypothetical protein
MKKLLRYAGYTVAGLLAVALFCGGECIPDYAPMIFSLTASPDSVPRNGMSTITCDAGDADTEVSELRYWWSADGGTISTYQDPTIPAREMDIGVAGSTAYWTAPDTPGTYFIDVTVKDDTLQSATDTVFVVVLDEHAPEIESLTADPASVEPGGISTITCAATDKDGDTLTYTFTAEEGIIGIAEGDNQAMWSANKLFDQLLEPGTYTVEVEVSDGKYITRGTVEVTVLGPNHPPEIDSVTLDPEIVAPGGTSIINLYVSDPDGDTLTVTWTALDGGILQANGPTATWTAADVFGNFLPEGYYYILITVDDGRGGKDSYTTRVIVEVGAGGTECPGGH